MQLSKLRAIGLIFGVFDNRWDERLRELKTFILLRDTWPKTCWVKPRAPSVEYEHKLAQWVSLQRSKSSKKILRQDRIDKLNSIGIVWTKKKKKKRKKRQESNVATLGGAVESSSSSSSSSSSVNHTGSKLEGRAPQNSGSNSNNDSGNTCTGTNKVPSLQTMASLPKEVDAKILMPIIQITLPAGTTGSVLHPATTLVVKKVNQTMPAAVGVSGYTSSTLSTTKV